MNLDSLKDLAESRPRIAAAVGLVSLIGAGVGAIANGVDILDIVQGKAKTEQAQKLEAEAREAKAIEAVASQAKASAAAQAEAQAWTTAIQTNTLAGYDFYLQAFPDGHFKAQAEDARTRLANAQSATRSFDASRLHPTVAAAVNAAREAAKEAAAKQTQAERAANMAQAAANQARAHVSGYDVIRFRDRDTFEGEVANGKANGLGVYVQGDARFAGDRFQGQHASGMWQGVGVFESASGQPGRPARYGGEFTGGQLAGMGVIMRADGVRQAGVVVNGALTGHGVETRESGERIEGEFKNGLADGFAAHWGADGRLIEAGRFVQGQLVQALTL